MEQNWLQIYRNFDDEALAALASAGLVRRAAKDVEAGKVAWESTPDPQQALLRADGQIVKLSPTGPAKASCDCPAPGVCKHILAAAIWLRTMSSTESNNAAPIDVLAEVMALAPNALFKAAGVAATRKAAALFSDTTTASISNTPNALLIHLPSLDITCRYIAHAGFAGMVSDAPETSRLVIHLLAITSVWRLQGRTFDWPSAATPAVGDAAPEGLSEAERQFLDRLRQLLLEAFSNGWSHVSEIVPAQLRGLAMSARVESFPRLAAMLRTLAGTAELLSKRDVSAEERQAMRLATRIYALSHALEQSAGEVLRDLRGKERRSFDAGQSLELLPLGAHWWEQRSGARGMTLSFLNADEQCIMQAALARRDASDQSFSRNNAWNTTVIWQGAGPAMRLADGTLKLDQVRVSGDSRISLSSETKAETLAPWRANDHRWQSAGYDDWNSLADALRASAGINGDDISVILLKPAKVDPPQLDEARQLFSWCLRDQRNQTLTLQLACDPMYHTRIDNIEGWAKHGDALKGVLVRLERNLHGGRLEPLTLMIERQGLLRAVSLDYEAPLTRPGLSLIQRLSRALKSGPAPSVAASRPTHADWIEELQFILENKAMTGRLHVPGEDLNRLSSIHAFLRSSGLDLLANTLQNYLQTPETALALALLYLCITCAELEIPQFLNCTP